MVGYMMNFGVYTMAMVGIIVVALLVYKKSSSAQICNKSNLKIDDKIALNARKSLYVVNAGGERFLIAGDIDNTSLIARLGQENVKEILPPDSSVKTLSEKTEKVATKSFISRETQTVKLPEFKTELQQNYTDAQKSLDEAFGRMENMKFDRYLDVKSIRKKPVMKELARKLAQI